MQRGQEKFSVSAEGIGPETYPVLTSGRDDGGASFAAGEQSRTADSTEW